MDTALTDTSRLPGGRHLGRGAAFSLLVFANVLLMASTSAPSPIYPLYLERWGFSVTILTVVFAVYVAGLVGALLTVGSLSDHLGRRPVLVASLWWPRPGRPSSGRPTGSSRSSLARVVQGIATGMATGALAAGLVEFSPDGPPPRGADDDRRGHELRAGHRWGSGWSARSGEPASRCGDLSGTHAGVRRPRGAGPRDPRDGCPTRRSTWPRCARESGFLAKRGGRSSPRCPPSSPDGPSPDCSSHSHRRWCATSCTSRSAPQAVSASRCCSSPIARVDCGRRGAPRESATLLGAVLLSLGAAGLAAALVFASPPVFIGGSIVSGLGVGLTFNGTFPRHQRGHHCAVAIGGLLRRLRRQLCGAGHSGFQPPGWRPRRGA